MEGQLTEEIAGGQANQLRKNSLGVGAITFLVVSAAAPLTAVAGGVPLSMLLGNGPGIPGTFAIVTALLLLFAVGYVAMSRHVKNAGAFYAYTARGMGAFGAAQLRSSPSWLITACRWAYLGYLAPQLQACLPDGVSICPGGLGAISASP